MSQSIERNGLLPHTSRTVTLLTRPVRSGPATAGLTTRLVLCVLAGLMSLFVVVGASADAASAAGPRQETAFEQRPGSEAAASLRGIDRTALDLEESGTHWRTGPALPALRPMAAGACRPCSDATPDGTDHTLPERPPRARPGA